MHFYTDNPIVKDKDYLIAFPDCFNEKIHNGLFSSDVYFFVTTDGEPLVARKNQLIGCLNKSFYRKGGRGNLDVNDNSFFIDGSIIIDKKQTFYLNGR